MGGRRRGFAAHNRSWVWGRHAVGETLQAQRWQPLEVRLSPRCPAALRQRLLHLCQQRSIPSSVVSDEELTQLCKTEEHQGVAMRLPPFPYANFSEQLTRRPPVWLVLDGIQDAYNYGAILRSAETLGITTVLVGERGQCEVNSLVVRSSAGAVNHLALVRVSDLTEAVRALRAEGYCVLAATEKGGIPVYRVALRAPIVFILGNEGEGIRKELLELSSQHVCIPLAGKVSSLNVAVAAGICCYEWRRQQLTAEEPAGC